LGNYCMTSASQQPSPPTYTPPSSTEIARRQDEPDALRPLYVQRKLYSKSKWFLALRMWGMGIIAIGAPVVAFKWPGTAVTVGAIAGGWLALGRLLFIKAEEHYTRQAAAVQEQFDTYTFDMPEIAVRPSLPTLEAISRIAGPDAELQAKATEQKLLAWYPIDTQDSGITAVAVSQRANASYSESLLKTTSRLWMWLVVIWSLVLVGISLKFGLSLGTFLLAVFLPLASPLIELFEYAKKIRVAAAERGSMSQEIEDKLRNNQVTGEELVIWQSRMYDLRITAPQIPNALYWWQRKKNEQAMHTAAQQLSDRRRRP
jgi:hypothetical protein